MACGPEATAGHLAQRKRHLGLAGLTPLSAGTGLGQPEVCQLWAVPGERPLWCEMEQEEKHGDSGSRDGLAVGSCWRPKDTDQERRINQPHSSCAWAPSPRKASTELSSETLSLPVPRSTKFKPLR